MDFARCNGAGVDWPGRIGKSRSEERGITAPFTCRVALLDQLDVAIECGGRDLPQLLQELILFLDPFG